jgi:hypothetical protein
MKIILKTNIIRLLPPNWSLIHYGKTLPQTFLKTFFNLQNDRTKAISLHKNVFHVELIWAKFKTHTLVQDKFVLNSDICTSCASKILDVKCVVLAKNFTVEATDGFIT